MRHHDTEKAGNRFLHMNRDKYEELSRYLPGLAQDSSKACEWLAEIFKYQVFELKDFCIPYMMNDAAEAYLVFENCRMTGEMIPDYEGEVTGRLENGNNGDRMLIVRQGEDNVFTLHYRELHCVQKLYQYHTIGHFWVAGEEQWRQLVYMVGTAYDKYEFLDQNACSSDELELLPLMQFAPFRFWSPIGESLEERYPSSSEGAVCMRKLCVEAGDRKLERLVGLYQKWPGGIAGRFLEYRIRKYMTGENGEKIYRCIREKINTASAVYPKRQYTPKAEEEIHRLRSEAQTRLEDAGFSGAYPMFRCGTMTVLATEEHPFTVLESESFHFRIQYMVSVCRESDAGVNSGFFRGKNRRGFITENLEEILTAAKGINNYEG